MGIARRCALGGAVIATVIAMAPHAYASQTLVAADMSLNRDHFGNIVLNTDGASLNCNFNTIFGDASQGATIQVTARWVTVENCVITGGTAGISLIDANEGNFIENTVNGSTGPGCLLVNSHLNAFTDSNFWNNPGGGCVLEGSNFNIFERNSISSNGDEGVDLETSNNNSFTGNEVFSNVVDGFDLGDSHANALRENAVGWNGMNGIELDDSEQNFIEDNDVSFNGRGAFESPPREPRSGISLGTSSNNGTRRNIVNGNSRNGLRIIDFSNTNDVDSNSGCNNGQIDGFVDASSVGNRFFGNMFCTGNIPA